jgi:16S rRNA (cytosine967-C5)-methyltransferase
VPGETEVWERDGREVGETDPEGFDRILIDAPCTGLGALRRRPEARWRKSPRDVAGLTPLQAELLDSGIRALAPGGVLAYVTCSPHLAETRAVVADALRRHPELEAIDTAAVLAGVTREPLDLPGDDASVQLWPHRHGTDAMFIALIGKPASVG